MRKSLTLLTLLLFSVTGFAQIEVSGTVTDPSGEPLPGVNVVVKGTTTGTATDFDGNYILSVSEEDTLIFSYIGFTTVEEAVAGRTKINIVMQEGLLLDEVQLVGSRSKKRTSTDTAVPVDVINVADVVTQSGRIEVNEMLQYAAPSFNANKQTGSDGADHVDPASLRGLGPDQTLVLINGKRRHQSSLINIFGTRGRGNTGTDLNAIPVTAIKRIEVLRDGAAAQYGSDAIAGVINIVLNDQREGVNGVISYGAYNTNAEGDFGTDPYGLWNTDGYRLDTSKDGNQIGEDKNFDGGSIKAGVNYGIGIGERGYVNFTSEFIKKDKTLRPAFEFRKGFGEAAISGFNFMVNSVIPVSENSEFYAFGGRNYRDTDAYAFTRNNPTSRNVVEIYPDGFTPRITSNITDNSVSAGFRTVLPSEWNLDISNTYGKNDFHYYIKGTLNASLGEISPTDFDAGGHTLSQNTINLDFSKYFEDVFAGMNLAFGAEYRTENFTIFAGEEASWGTYDENGVLITDPANQSLPVDPVTGDPRPGGSQGFPGYAPDNEVDRNRSNVSLYADAEFDLTEAFMVSTAVRFEEYTDFGSTLNGKLASRLKLGEHFNLRGSVSTGFRAPSLAQLYYNLKFTNFIGGQALESLLSPNASPVTGSFGIGPLKEETALNAGLGFTATFGDFSATVDGYYIDIDDRIVLTGNFDAPQIPNVEAAQFFANGVDTRTKGVDVVLSYNTTLGNGRFSTVFTGNFNDMEILEIKNGDLEEETFFARRDQVYLLASAPDSKMALNLNYSGNLMTYGLAFTRFSKIEILDYQMYEAPEDLGYANFDELVIGATDTYDPKIVTDLVVGVKLSESLNLNVGANNLLNVYPDQQDDWTEAGGYWDSVQMGFGGAFYYARMNFNF
ncbi:TonB-dependent receptor [Robertkochia marina]|uniref:TonB-dependent receptor n=1 Tax=Robertkochia marina TaxID=1227945 RepID=A0A4S3M2M2_9FLAO|nr:TonB-dependent receptor [Robertkochia marina]THD67859.1 TonB-dependent receptor [Robertkochia marina]TRZ42102.1 TonB-dependent receptor [Robertkochia marina]